MDGGEPVPQIGSKGPGQADALNRAAIRQKCADCVGRLATGHGFDCQEPWCPLYPYMPWHGKGDVLQGRRRPLMPG